VESRFIVAPYLTIGKTPRYAYQIASFQSDAVCCFASRGTKRAEIIIWLQLTKCAKQDQELERIIQPPVAHMLNVYCCSAELPSSFIYLELWLSVARS